MFFCSCSLCCEALHAVNADLLPAVAGASSVIGRSPATRRGMHEYDLMSAFTETASDNRCKLGGYLICGGGCKLNGPYESTCLHLLSQFEDFLLLNPIMNYVCF